MAWAGVAIFLGQLLLTALYAYLVSREHSYLAPEDAWVLVWMLVTTVLASTGAGFVRRRAWLSSIFLCLAMLGGLAAVVASGDGVDIAGRGDPQAVLFLVWLAVCGCFVASIVLQLGGRRASLRGGSRDDSRSGSS